MRQGIKGLGWLLLILVLIAVSFRVWAAIRESESVATLMPDDGKIVAGLFTKSWGEPENPTVILLHGTGAWSGLWHETGQALAQAGYHAVAIDIPPFGFSDRDPENNYSRTKQASRVMDFLTELSLPHEAPIMIAHSFGASVGVETVLRFPERFSGLIVIDGALGIGSTKTPQDAIPWMIEPPIIRETVVSLTATNPYLTKTLLSALVHRKDRADEPYLGILKIPAPRKGNTKALAAWLPWLLAAHPEDISTKSSAYYAWAGPTEILWGDKDTVTPIEQGRELAGLLKGSQMTVLEDVGHIPQIEDPQLFQRELIKALGRISRQQ